MRFHAQKQQNSYPGKCKATGAKMGNKHNLICADAPKSQTAKDTRARLHDRSIATAAGAGPPLHLFRTALSAIENRQAEISTRITAVQSAWLALALVSKVTNQKELTMVRSTVI